MLYFHEEKDECIDRSITYNIPHDRELKYNHYHTAYYKDYVIYADLEAINKKIRDEMSEGYNREVDKNFAEVDEFNFKQKLRRSRNVRLYQPCILLLPMIASST